MMRSAEELEGVQTSNLLSPLSRKVWRWQGSFAVIKPPLPMTTEVTGSEERRTFLGQSQSLNRSRRKFGGGGDAGQCEGEGGAGRRVRYHCTLLAWNKKTAWMEGNWWGEEEERVL